MNHNITIGSKIKALRISKKYTLKQLSVESGLSTGFLSQLERGVSSIAIDSLAKIAEILNVSLSSFFDETA
ncbi:MAG: helix-turn-helix transcriptional regulator, partial [Oscillospiraceae bacterium]